MRNNDRGIVLISFGKPAYGKLAYNLALSIRYFNKSLPIQLVHDEVSVSQLRPHHKEVFDIRTPLQDEDLFVTIDKGRVKEQRIQPGKPKTRLYKYMAFEHSLYLDVDGVAIRDLDGLLQACIDKGGCYYSQVVGKHTIDKGRDFKEMQWAWADDVWKKYQLPEDAVMPATNSSFSFIRKSKESEALFKQMQANIADPIPLDQLRTTWGDDQPDELYLNIALAQLGIDADLGMHPILFSNGLVRNFSALAATYYVIGIYGGKGFTHSSLTDYYERLMHKYCREGFGINHEFKLHHLVQHKHANKRLIRPLQK